MFNYVVSLIKAFMTLWSSLSDRQKEKIIDVLVDSFEVAFRHLFREKTKEKGNSHD